MAKTIQPDSHYHLKTASNPAISPNDKAVVFTVHRFEEGSHEASTNVFVKSLGSASALNQITSSGTAITPKWSSDGKKIAFLDEDEKGVKQIFTRVAAGGEPVALTNQSSDVDAFAYSPDGSKMAFRSLVLGEDELKALDSDSATPKARVIGSRAGNHNVLAIHSRAPMHR